jgi:hypothetical protein
MVRFTPDFEPLPGTKLVKAPALPTEKDPFEADEPPTPRVVNGMMES